MSDAVEDILVRIEDGKKVFQEILETIEKEKSIISEQNETLYQNIFFDEKKKGHKDSTDDTDADEKSKRYGHC